MNYRIVCDGGRSRLILIFAGWAMDWRPFSQLSRPGYDIAVVWDYRKCDIDWNWVAGYDEICVIAWSLGVSVASSGCLDSIESRITLRLAVNGTMYPVDDERGIPRSVFAGTRDGLCGRSLNKFYRRVAGSREAYSVFSEKLPQRSLAELSEELDLFLDSALTVNTGTRWDRAIIATEDAIFPVENQKRAWIGVPTDIEDGTHLPEFQTILDRYIVDKDLAETRFASGLRTYGKASVVQKLAVEHLWACACDEGVCDGAHGRILEIGSGSGFLSHKLEERFENEPIEMWDLAGEAPLAGTNRTFRRGDAEQLIRYVADGSLGLIASASTIQWFNSPRRFLEHCARSLKTGSYAVISSFTTGNMDEISRLTGRTLPLMSQKQWCETIPGEFEILRMEESCEILTFNSGIDVFRHLKATGVNSLGRSRGNGLRSALSSMQADVNGKFRLTYRPIYMLLKKK